MSNNERNELAEAIDGATDSWNEPVYGAASTALAKAILAAGYRKPRVIATVEDLIDAEDPETILKDKFGQPHQWGIDANGDEGWMSPQDQRVTKSRTLWRFAPITVLHEPTN